MKACTLNNCANGCRSSLKVASTYLWGYIDRLIVASTVKNTIIILQKCKPKARGITYFFHSKEKSHSMKIISHIYLTRNHLTLQRLYRRHYPANLYIHNLCSRPEDGLRCRQGVKPPRVVQRRGRAARPSVGQGREGAGVVQRRGRAARPSWVKVEKGRG